MLLQKESAEDQMHECGTSNQLMPLDDALASTSTCVVDLPGKVSLIDHNYADVEVIDPADIEFMPIIVVSEPTGECSEFLPIADDAHASGDLNEPQIAETQEMANMEIIPIQMQNEISSMLDELLADEAIDAALQTIDLNTIDLGHLDDIPEDVISEFL